MAIDEPERAGLVPSFRSLVLEIALTIERSFSWSIFKQVWVGLVVALVVICLRVGLLLAFGASIPYPLVFPGVVSAGLVGGWRAGATTSLIVAAFGYAYRNPLQGISADVAFVTVLVGCASVIVCTEFARQPFRTLQRAKIRETHEGTLRIFVEQAPVAICMLDREMRYLAASEMWCANYGLEPRNIIGRDHYDVHPGIPEEWRVAHQRSLSGVRLSAEGASVLGVGGGLRWKRWSTQPWHTPAGDVGGITIFTEDVTERVEALRQLQESQSALVHAQEVAKIGSWEWRRGDTFYSASAEMCRLLSFKPGTLIDIKDFRSAIDVDDRDKLDLVWPHLMQGTAHEALEIRVLSEGRRRWLRILAEPMRDQQGKLIGATGTLQDITEDKQAEQRLKVVMGEVNHRSKNLLSVVQAIAQQTTAEVSPERFLASFSSRLTGLAKSHDLLVKSEWKGVKLSELLFAQLIHFKSIIGSRIAYSGPDVLINSQASQTFGMALHELATNSVKHGALSVPSGVVRIEWKISAANDDGVSRLEIRWSEEGGPKVSSPSRRGFGHVVTVEMIEHAFEGRVITNFAEGGFTWEASVPVDQVLVEELSAKEGAGENPDSGRRVAGGQEHLDDAFVSRA